MIKNENVAAKFVISAGLSAVKQNSIIPHQVGNEVVSGNLKFGAQYILRKRADILSGTVCNSES